MITSMLLTAQNTKCDDSHYPQLGTNTENSKSSDQEQEGHKRPSKQEIMSQKIAFFTQELSLTPQEAEKFWPVYNKSWHARGSARRATMENLEKLNEALEADTPVSDIQIQALSDAYIDSFKKEGEVFISYFNNFKKILPLRKAVKVFSAEEKFRVMLIKQLRGKD